MEERNIAKFPRPVYGRIPNFVGSEVAAQRLAELEEFRRARVVKVNPDAPQQPVRLLALQQGKIVVMPTPRLRQGFLVIDPRKVPRDRIHEASTIKGAFRWGVFVDPWSLPKIDLVVVGSVAVDLKGSRLGKGEGYGELEYAILRMFCRVDESTPVVTTVHDVQIVDAIPREKHDLTVDIVVTPTRVLRITPRPPKPSGILWDKLDPKKFEEIPLLRRIRELDEKHLSTLICKE